MAAAELVDIATVTEVEPVEPELPDPVLIEPIPVPVVVAPTPAEIYEKPDVQVQPLA